MRWCKSTNKWGGKGRSQYTSSSLLHFNAWENTCKRYVHQKITWGDHENYKNLYTCWSLLCSRAQKYTWKRYRHQYISMRWPWKLHKTNKWGGNDRSQNIPDDAYYDSAHKNTPGKDTNINTIVRGDRENCIKLTNEVETTDHKIYLMMLIMLPCTKIQLENICTSIH